MFLYWLFASWCLLRLVTKDNVTEFRKEGAHEGLGEEIGQHVLSGTVAHLDVIRLQAIGDPEESMVNVLGALPRGGPPVGGQLDGALVVLLKIAVNRSK